MQTKAEIIEWLEGNKQDFIRIADYIWENPETAWKEFKSSRVQADYLEKEGFRITWDIAEISTAFIAEWGEGKPVIGFIGEFDALPGLSQKRQVTQEALEKGAPGHGCGHNLLGTGCLASAVAVKRWLEDSGRKGTVRYYGCPAEEGGGGKTFMARAGAFDDLDAALNFHPASLNFPMKGSNVGVNHMRFRFRGRASHAGGSPHLGRSALDAVELMNVGVNYLREHVTDDVRLHYVITNGGQAPNIVPEEAEVFYYVRAHDRANLEDVTNRVRKIAEGATLMTETSYEEEFESAYSSLLNNHVLADLQYEAMKIVGPIEYTPEEIAFAQGINDSSNNPNSKNIDGTLDTFKPKGELRDLIESYRTQPIIGENFPPMDEDVIGTGSTDVGDVSWITPVSLLRVACWPTGALAHGWAVVAACGTSIGHKGMMHAAKIMALAAVDLFLEPGYIQKAQDELKRRLKGGKYRSPLPDHVHPPRAAGE